MPIIGCIKSGAASRTSALVNREVALATRQLPPELQSARHEHHLANSSLESNLTRLVGLCGLSSSSHICGALSSDFPSDWELVLDFMGRHTSPGSGRVDDKIEDFVARFDVVPSLPGGVWSQRSLTEQPGTTSTSDQVINMKNDIADLRDRISSNSISVDSFIFPSLGKTVAWCIQHLPGDVEQALICLDAPSLLHGIDREFLSNQDTRESLYQNKKAGISSFSLTLHSSFSTVLPEILGKSITIGVEDNGFLLPSTKTYKGWFCNENGVNTGIKTQIVSGLEHQRAIHYEVLTNLAVTHPVGAQLGRLLLQRSCAFVEFMITALANAWSEYLSRGGDIQTDEDFLMFCAIMRQIFREFRKVRHHGVAAIQQVSVAQRVGNNWWYVLQTHLKMVELLQIGFKQHPTITPVFTAHLDRHWVSKTSFATLETSVRKVKIDMAAMQTSVNCLNGARENSTPRSSASTGGLAPP
jgi:hypothetical protein